MNSVLKYSSQAYIKGEHKISQKDCNIKTSKYKEQNKKASKRSFKHIDQIQRGQIRALLQEGKSVAYIAKVLGRSRTTIYNELKRGATIQIKNKKKVEVYLPDKAQIVYEQNRKKSKKALKIHKCSKEFIEYLVESIKQEKWSVDETISRAKKQRMFEIIPSYKTIYNYIEKRILQIKNIDLALKVKRKARNKIGIKNKKIYGTSISQRPQYIEQRQEFGHWEGDTVQGKKKKGEVIISLVERKTRYSIFVKVKGKDNESIKQGLREILKEYEETSIYYAHPYSAFERGTNERHNGLLRMFIPKGKDISKYSKSNIEEYTDKINAKPRKILGYNTPEELFDKELDRIYKTK